ncbi:hypothetical protein CFR80_11250 [Komagataeibacter oboediens]|uniref:DUF3800 domain-containing protein n=1 Tax=Komagataeibacter oboediens TaxID=65958 RepID=A0A318QW16_9PROT|nr:DUF3800 domain-containing protein [Komagataeibacter oboediens]PYD81501.1 hypothetical protein CFR80_11250 [Komagataeibacter oboediens]
MTHIPLYNVYCDESCHLEHDGVPVMAWGAITCPKSAVRNVAEKIRTLKMSHGLSTKFEAKWTKISPAKLSFYLGLIDLFLSEDCLNFRGLVVPDKQVLDHSRFDQSHNDWYYKMYFVMLRHIFCAQHRYCIYLDIKDTCGGPKTRKLHEVLANTLHDFNQQTIQRVQQIRSHESELLQITDILIGALTYANRGLKTSQAKSAIVTKIQTRLGTNALNCTSSFSATKFNILVWRAREMAE